MSMETNNVSSVDKFSVSVSGKLFQLRVSDILEYPNSLLAKSLNSNTRNNLDQSYDRPVSSFKSVAALYQTGELHMPKHVCPKEFVREIQFWGFDVERLEPCCYILYKRFLDECTKIKDFQSTFAPEKILEGPEIRNSCKWRVRQFLDNPSSSIGAKIYLAIVVFFVLLSILTMCIGTIPGLREVASKDEMLKYAANEGSMEDYKVLYNILYAVAHDYDAFDYLYDAFYNYEDYYNGNSSEIENQDKAKQHEVIRRLKVLSLKRKAVILRVFDYIITAFFTLEILARLASCPSLARYFRSAFNTIDMLVLLLAYTEIILMKMHHAEKFKTKGIEILHYFQIVRVFRILRIVKNVTAIKVLVYSLKTSYKDFLVLLLYIGITLVVFGSLFYFAEPADNITSIPEAMWLSIITMTTVGYGDFYPRSLVGKLIGGLCALTGVLLLSLIIPVFVGTFVSVYEYASCARPPRAATKTAVVSPSPIKEKDKQSVL